MDKRGLSQVLTHPGTWSVGPWVPFLIVLGVSAAVLFLTDLALRRYGRRVGAGPFGRMIVMLVLTGFALVLVVLVLPWGRIGLGRDGNGLGPAEMLGVLGLGLTAIVALSSTSFLSNAMAGLMLRSVGSFRPGDFVKVGEQFGRVTERGLFHTEIQTEDRDLTTLPNLYLVSNPVTVVRYSGTIVSCTLSLGYDVPFGELKPLLLEATAAAGLQDGFVQILELDNFSIQYRVAGFLSQVKQLVTARSNLRIKVLETLSRAGIEIVSPTFMNQRILREGARVIAPEAREATAAAAEPEKPPEELIFDKAEEAAGLEELRGEIERLTREIGAMEEQRDELDEAERTPVDREIELRRRRIETINARLEQAEKTQDGGDQL